MKTAREVLDWLDDWMVARVAEESEEASKLWDVMSALRGPDDSKSLLKDSTTCYVRHAAFPKLAKLARRELAIGKIRFVSFDTAPRSSIPALVTGDHFLDHIVFAARWLGLLETPRRTEDTGSSAAP